MELVLIAGVVSLALGAVGSWWWLSDEQVVKRKIKSADVVRIAEAKEGDLIKIVGRLAFDEDVQPLEGPLTGRRCVGYHVEVLEKYSRGKSSQWHKIISTQEMVDFLMAYLDGELPTNQVTEFETHMNVCPPCVDYLNSYKTTVDLGKAACADPDGPVPDAVPDRLVEAILAARRKS